MDEQILLSYVGTSEVSDKYRVEIIKEAGAIFMKINDVFFVSDEDMVLEFISKDKRVIQLRLSQSLSTKIADKLG